MSEVPLYHNARGSATPVLQTQSKDHEHYFQRPSCNNPFGLIATLEATQGPNDGFFSQLPYKCHQNRVASVGD